MLAFARRAPLRRLAALPAPTPHAILRSTPALYRHLSSTAGGDAPPKADEPAAEEAASTQAPSDASEPQPSGEEPSEIDQLNERIKALEEEGEKKHDQLLRALADADNVKRRAAIDVANSKKFAIEKFAKSLLDVADNLQRAAESVPEEARASEEHPILRGLYDGVLMTDAVLHKCFAEHGLTKMEPMGEKFDPNMHEALFDMPDPDKEPGTIAFVSTSGYMLNDRCLRAAQVGITKKPPE